MKQSAWSVRAAVALMAAVGVVRSSWADEAVTVRGPVVVSGHPEATRVGLDVMRQGGNAVDALVATSMALGVVEAGNSGLGGKLIVVYYNAATRNVTTMVALNPAPRKLDVATVVDAPAASHSSGWSATCVPGLTAGLGAVHTRWGSKPWKDLLQPSVKLATDGFVVSERLADMWKDLGNKVDGEAARIYLPDGKPPVAGQRVNNPDLGRTLETIANGGWQAFYHGEIPKKFVAAANKAGWPMSEEDFAEYRPRFLEPLTYTYKGNTAYTAPAPLTGGAMVMGTLKVLEGQSWAGQASSSRDPAFVDALGRAFLEAASAVSRTAGDTPTSAEKVKAAFTPDAVAKMVAAARSAADTAPATAQRASTRPTTRNAAEPEGRGPALPDRPQLASAEVYELTGDDSEHGCTTPLIIQDAAGNVVVATQSLGLHYGAKVVADGTGVLLNSDMSNFAYRTPTSVNYVAPGKWPRSTIAPTLVLKNGRPLVATSGAGGGRIPTATAQVLLDVLEFGRDPVAAVRTPRVHFTRGAGDAPDNLDLENGTPQHLVETLTARGWRTDLRKPGGYYFANIQLLRWTPDGRATGVADTRRASDAAGLNIPD